MITSTARDPRTRARFRGPVQTRGVCRTCELSFTYDRHIGRPRAYCSHACANLHRIEGWRVIAAVCEACRVPFTYAFRGGVRRKYCAVCTKPRALPRDL